MANFSVNQVRQFYAASAYKTTVANTDTVGTIGAVTKTGEGDELFFFFKGADTVLKSDQIQIKNIGFCKAYAASDLITVMKTVKVTLDTDVNGGDPAVGEDYVLGINFKNFFSSGDASQYYKDVAVHVTAAMAADEKEFYKAMVDALNLAFSREDGATADSNPYLSFSAGTAGSEDGIYIQEKPQAWTLGTKKANRIMFDVFPGTIKVDGDDQIWGEVTDTTPAKADAISDGTEGTDYIGNGQKIADLEWFCAGERGDQYRMKGWPNYVPTQYLINAANQYHVLEIHYAFTDTGVNSYRTEKEITIVVPTSAKAALNSFIGALNTAISGSSSAPIATLS